MTTTYLKSCYHLSDSELIVRITEMKDDSCFSILYQRHYKRVYRHCMTYVKDADWVEDYTQSVFLQVYQKLSQFKNQSSFSHWLSVLTKNYCLNQFRVQKRTQTAISEWCNASYVYDSTDDEQDNFETLTHVLKLINVQDRTLLHLKYEQGYSLKEIATQYNVRTSTIKMRLLRARRAVYLYAKSSQSL
ncbi:RNA polymerase sigma factor [Tellurirhabdus bombi]|uniref:RNA polymerase sigma factor n=1 Tax=Tellurirhabdus bombi TaxID=2907205 RepID=UPI00286DF955|nr:RNA polymerase sigma factor [Tellurirhabdus bombi]